MFVSSVVRSDGGVCGADEEGCFVLRCLDKVMVGALLAWRGIDGEQVGFDGEVWKVFFFFFFHCNC